MHPCLKLSNLSRLPSALRVRANAALTGYTGEIPALVSRIPEMASENLPFLLPMLYALIDTARIPAALGQSVVDPMPHAVQAVFALRGLCQIMDRFAIPSAALVELWMRAGPWIEFLDEYRDHLFGLERFSPQLVYSMFVRLLRCMRGNDRNVQVARLMDKSLELCVMVGRAWHHLIDAVDEDEDGLLNVSHFLSRWCQSNNGWDNTSFEALLTGAGGRMSLASLLVSHFRLIVPRSDSTITADTASHLSGSTFLLCSKVDVAEAEYDIAFHDALLSHGLVRTLTTVAQAVSHSADTLARPILNGIISTLVFCLSSGSRNTGKWITESLRAGLLPAIISNAAVLGKAPDTRLVSLLRTVLPASTVYHSVLSQLRISLADVSRHDSVQALAQGGLLELWREFLTLVESRVRILDRYNMGGLKAKRVCDYLEASIILFFSTFSHPHKCSKNCYTHELKRCSDCSMAHYCSEVCQSGDWRAGHRLNCAALARRYYENSYIISRDKSFMRALVHHEYISNLEQVALRHLPFMRRKPFLMPYILFDYTEGKCIISVLLPDRVEFQSLYDFQRAADSGGRLQLHLLRVIEGRKTRNWDFVQKSSPEFVAGLKAIAETLPPQLSQADLEKHLPDIRELINSTQPTIQ